MRPSAARGECQTLLLDTFFLSPPKWNNFLPDIFAPRWLRAGSNHYPGYDIEKCPHPLLSPLSASNWADRQTAGLIGEILNSSVWFSLLKIAFDDLKPEIISCYRLWTPQMTARHKTDPPPPLKHYQGRKEGDWDRGINFVLSLSTRSQWSVEGTQYSGGGGISIKFSKMVFLYKCTAGSNFSVYAQRFKFRPSTKVILPGAGQDLDPSQARTWFSYNFSIEAWRWGEVISE